MSQTAEAAQWAKAEAVETLTNKKLGKIEASTTTEDMMPATNSNTPTVQTKTVSETTTTPVMEPSLVVSAIMVVVLAEAEVEVEPEAVAVALVLAVESEREGETRQN